MLPPLFFGTVIGLYLDKTDKRVSMIHTCFLRCILVLLCVFCQTPEMLIPLYILIFLRYTGNSFYVPARTAMVPGVVTKADLLVANGLDGVVWSSMIFFGGALGGLGTALVGVTWSFVLDAFAYLAAAYVIALLPLDIAHKDNHDFTSAAPTLLDPFREGLSSVRRNTLRCYFYVCCCLPLRRREGKDRLRGEYHSALQGRGLAPKTPLVPGDSTRSLLGGSGQISGDLDDEEEI